LIHDKGTSGNGLEDTYTQVDSVEQPGEDEHVDTEDSYARKASDLFINVY
jgi:hypothetical protein